MSQEEKAKNFLKFKHPQKYADCIERSCNHVGILSIGSGCTIIECSKHKYKEIVVTSNVTNMDPLGVGQLQI